MTEGLWQLGERRGVCVGYRVAQMELFVAVARLAAGFDFVVVSFPSFLPHVGGFCGRGESEMSGR